MRIGSRRRREKKTFNFSVRPKWDERLETTSNRIKQILEPFTDEWKGETSNDNNSKRIQNCKFWIISA